MLFKHPQDSRFDHRSTESSASDATEFSDVTVRPRHAESEAPEPEAHGTPPLGEDLEAPIEGIFEEERQAPDFGAAEASVSSDEAFRVLEEMQAAASSDENRTPFSAVIESLQAEESVEGDEIEAAGDFEEIDLETLWEEPEAEDADAEEAVEIFEEVAAGAEGEIRPPSREMREEVWDCALEEDAEAEAEVLETAEAKTEEHAMPEIAPVAAGEFEEGHEANIEEIASLQSVASDEEVAEAQAAEMIAAASAALRDAASYTEVAESVDDESEDKLDTFRVPVEGGRARLRVIGVGGAGTNSVTSMMRLDLADVEFLVVNTDVQALKNSPCELRLQIGSQLTRGLGAGSDPEIGAAAAEESREEIRRFLQDADMVFITCGMGGGTGTGAAPVVAQIAREMGVLSVGVCTKPFRFEGPRRRDVAERGLKQLARYADTMIVVSNEKLLEAVGPTTPIQEAFEVANSVLAQGVAAISELVSVPGLINVDFADVRAILSGSGDAVMGIGRARGEQRATIAVNKACSSQLLEKLVIEGAKGILICVHGGEDLTLHEVNEAASIVNNAASPDANIIFGAVVDDMLEDELKVTVLATGFAPHPSEEVRALHARKNLPRADEEPTSPSHEGGSHDFAHEIEDYSPIEAEPLAATAGVSGERSSNGNGSYRDRLALAGHDMAEDEADVPAYKRIRRRPRGRFF